MESNLLDELFGEGTLEKLKNHSIDENTLEKIRKYNNPDNKQTGPYTGRCMYCHGHDLWDDMATYGCNTCETIYSGYDLPPKIVMNAGVPETPDVREYNALLDDFVKKGATDDTMRDLLNRMLGDLSKDTKTQ